MLAKHSIWTIILKLSRWHQREFDAFAVVAIDGHMTDITPYWMFAVKQCPAYQCRLKNKQRSGTMPHTWWKKLIESHLYGNGFRRVVHITVDKLGKGLLIPKPESNMKTTMHCATCYTIRTQLVGPFWDWGRQRATGSFQGYLPQCGVRFRHRRADACTDARR